MGKFGIKESVVVGLLSLLPSGVDAQTKTPPVKSKPVIVEEVPKALLDECAGFADRVARLVYEFTVIEQTMRKDPPRSPMPAEAVRLMAEMKETEAREGVYIDCLLAGGINKMGKR
ncbi:MAG: hypothetical protein WCT53_04245 [Candidatus Gracilibacteria bacterium]